MKYFIDTEFLEGTQKENFPISLFRKKTPPTIDLISIGIVAEDGREYYAISRDFNLKEAWNRYDELDTFTNTEWHKSYWIRDNVLKPIFDEMTLWDRNNDKHSYFTYNNFEYLLSLYGKSNKQISQEVKDFCLGIPYWHIIGIGSKGTFPNNVITKSYERYYDNKKCWETIRSLNPEKLGLQEYDVIRYVDNEPKFYAYYADYDWIAFCWLFGKMMDLPKGFPMYCRDLKQMFDERQELDNEKAHEFQNVDLKVHPNYPIQENEHNALADARWNKKLFEFLKMVDSPIQKQS